MPLFGNKFSPKKAPQRKSISDSPRDTLAQLLTDQRTAQLKLGDHQFLFDNGDWIPESGHSNIAHKSKQKLKKRIQELEEENNLLSLKYEMMLNMLTQAASEGQLNHAELDKLKKKKK